MEIKNQNEWEKKIKKKKMKKSATLCVSKKKNILKKLKKPYRSVVCYGKSKFIDTV
jgi:hypothetical protein